MLLSNIAALFLAIAPFLPVISAGKVTNPSRVPKNAVLLSKVSTLTLRDGKRTASRRVSAVSQLDCVGPKDVCKLYKIDVMRCVNEGAGYDAANIQWSCKASLPEEFKLGSADVLCEGYESSDDPYVLKGSCGVEYRLLLTEKGERKYGRKQPNVNVDFKLPPIDSFGNTLFGLLFFAIFFWVLFIILKGVWSSWTQNGPQPRGPRRGAGGGGGGNNNDDDNDPPPPYDGPPSYYTQPRKPGTRTTPSGSTSTRASSSRQTRTVLDEGWRPGFWTGTAAGAAAGYLYGNRGQTRSETRQPQPETQQRPGGFFSNFGSTQRRNQPAQPSSPSVTETSDSSSYSFTRHESTGFGSTRRR